MLKLFNLHNSKTKSLLVFYENVRRMWKRICVVAAAFAGDGVRHCMAQKNSRCEVGRLWFLWTFRAAQFAAVPHAGRLACPE
jgi:hypothetical protein